MYSFVVSLFLRIFAPPKRRADDDTLVSEGEFVDLYGLNRKVQTICMIQSLRRKWKNHEETANVQLNQDVASNLGKDWVDSIKAPLAGDLLKKYAINRTIAANKGIGHWYDSHNFLTFGFTPAHNDKVAFTLDINHRFTEEQNDIYEHDNIDIFKHEDIECLNSDNESKFFNRYNPSHDKNHNIATNFTIDFIGFKDNNLSLGVKHYHEHTNTNRPLYLLNKLEGWDTRDIEHSLGDLPSMEEWLTTMDMQNSSHTIKDINKFTPFFRYTFNHDNDSTKVNQYIYAIISADITQEDMNYERGNVLNTNLNRNVTTWNANLYFSRSKGGTPNYTSINLEFGESLPALTTLLNIRDDSDPMNVTLGNPNLKRSYTYNASYYIGKKTGKIVMYGGSSAYIRQNAVAQGFVINQKGERTTKPENVNGNWNANIYANIDFPLDRNEKLRLQNNISYNFSNNVDLVGTSTTDSIAQRSVVKNNIISNDLRLTWQPTKKMEYGLFGNVNIQRSTSKRENFTNIEAYTFNYGCRLQLELPWNINVSSDLTMYCRRGYDDDAMNNNELVWNARLSKRMCKGKFTIMFDGFDILGNLSNVYRNVNGRGRTETFYNVIPSYGLMRLVYRFNKQPKKS